MSSLIQILAPLFPISRFDGTFARDLHRTEQVWDSGLDRIWLVPGTTEKSFWRRPLNGFLFGEGIIPAERPNAISVIHIDEDRQLYPPMLLPKQWGGRLPIGLYRQWLNAKPYPRPPLETIRMFVPRAKDGRIGYGLARLKIDPGPMLPISAEEDNGERTIKLSWPPNQEPVSPVSPETESAQHYGRPRRHSIVVNGHEMDGVRSEQIPEEEGVTSGSCGPSLSISSFPMLAGRMRCSITGR